VCGASLAGARFPTALPVGTTLQEGKYRIDGVLGQGGFGITYKAHSTALDIPVALKEFHPQGASRAGTSLRAPGTLTQKEFAEARRRFADEARTVARLTYAKPNPHIVRVYDVFTENDTEYYAMEFLEGRPLSGLVEKQGPFPEADAVTIGRQIVTALEDVHHAGMLHRDVKPDNVMMTARGAVLIDFGSARAIAAAGRQSIVITPGYAPLEQYASEAKRGPFTDVYALAATLFFALTGKEPVAATDRASGIKQPTARESNPRVSQAVSEAIDRAMSMRVDQRPQTARDFLQQLEQAAGGTRGAPAPQAAARRAPAPPSVQPAPQQAGPGAQATPFWPPKQAPAPANHPVQVVPRQRQAASQGGSMLFFWLVAAGLVAYGGIREQPQVLTAGIIAVALLSVYSLLHWMATTRAGRVVLLLVILAVGAFLYITYGGVQ
jgi:serine/threonine protein kinase